MPTATEHECRICGAVARHQEIVLKESMFQTWEEFRYFLCTSCACLQISTIPADLPRHYPGNYYSLGNTEVDTLRKRLKTAVLRHIGGNGSFAGAVLNALQVRPNDALWLEAAGIKAASRILDVGCGSGERLMELARAGFSNLAGVDPFIAADRVLDRGLSIRKAELAEIRGEFDLIMFHHSLEHMADPCSEIRHASRLLAARGRILIRVPVMGKWAWRHYEKDWVQLDPPRHLYTFSETALDRIARAANLKVEKTVYDSTSLQFEGSERIVSLKTQQSAAIAPAPSKAPIPISEMKRRTTQLNHAGDGDQACFFLARAPAN